MEHLPTIGVAFLTALFVIFIFWIFVLQPYLKREIHHLATIIVRLREFEAKFNQEMSLKNNSIAGLNKKVSDLDNDMQSVLLSTQGKLNIGFSIDILEKLLFQVCEKTGISPSIVTMSPLESDLSAGVISSVSFETLKCGDKVLVEHHSGDTPVEEVVLHPMDTERIIDIINCGKVRVPENAQKSFYAGEKYIKLKD